jgi:hypothetical protein
MIAWSSGGAARDVNVIECHHSRGEAYIDSIQMTRGDGRSEALLSYLRRRMPLLTSARPATRKLDDRCRGGRKLPIPGNNLCGEARATTELMPDGKSHGMPRGLLLRTTNLRPAIPTVAVKVTPSLLTLSCLRHFWQYRGHRVLPLSSSVFC